MKGKNPFCISFGRQPVNYIDRTVDKAKVLDTFTLDPITDQLFLITGVRGTGKTVFMNTIANTLEKDDSWIVLRISASSDINQAVYADLYHRTKLHGEAIQQMSVSLAGVGISVSRKEPTENVISQIDTILEQLQKHKKKVLVTIDEVMNTPQMREFSHMFQIECSRNRPLFFLGTGLYENLQALCDEKDMTFLHRAPKIVLTPLNNMAVADSYADIFRIPKEKALAMSELVQGYSFAFQALGYIYWEHECPDDLNQVLPDYDVLLADASYSKIWSECTPKEQELLAAMAKSKSESVMDIRDMCQNMPSNYFSVYRSRLMKRGIVFSPAKGLLRFSLTRFREFVLNCIYFM